MRDLIASQFPAWAELPIDPVERSGHDNRTFRLGSEMSVRLPSHERYAPQVLKEQKWLPILAPSLPVAIPTPLALGAPALGYPWHWSVYRWLEGENAIVAPIGDPTGLATDVGQFLRALHRVDPAGGPRPGPHNFFRGGPLSVYDEETRVAIRALGSQLDRVSVTEVWEAALQSSWQGNPVWLHGDLAASNLLVRRGRVAAVIDFGCAAVGDPACDLAIAWTFFSGPSRALFRSTLSLDEATWARARGWTIWKALITLAGHRDQPTDITHEARCVIDGVMAERG